MIATEKKGRDVKYFSHPLSSLSGHSLHHILLLNECVLERTSKNYSQHGMDIEHIFRDTQTQNLRQKNLTNVSGQVDICEKSMR